MACPEFQRHLSQQKRNVYLTLAEFQRTVNAGTHRNNSQLHMYVFSFKES
jgi:hypothetical protein